MTGKKGGKAVTGKRTTVYDVAKALSISTSTVSRVLNNSILIGEEKRNLILATARRLGYQKRPIKKQQFRAILNIKLFLPTHRQVYSHLFYNAADLIAGLYDGFGDVKVNLITKLVGLEDDLFRSKKLGDIDGCVFAFSEPEDAVYRRISERGIPIVELNRINEARNYVSCDNALGMATLLAEAVKRKKKPLKPCYLGFSQIPAIDFQRRKGFLEAAKNLGLGSGVKDAFTIGALSEIDAAFLAKLKKKGYNAVFCFNDVLAVYVYQAALSEGRRIPEDFSLTGFDDSPVLDLVSRRIDTINLSVRLLGKEAGFWLRERIIDRKETELKRLIAGDYVPGVTIG